jgi:hypothetical protein
MSQSESPTLEDYEESVLECAEEAAERYESVDEDVDDLAFSERLPKIIRSVIENNEWLGRARSPLTVYYSDQSPDDPTHLGGIQYGIDLKSEPSWDKIAAEAGYMVFYSDVYLKATELIG